jgi:hypothetical protein
MQSYNEQKTIRDWVVGEGYNAFCTLKFKNGYDISEHYAERLAGLFLQKVDRTFWGKCVESRNLRCPRFVFLHKGTSGYNTHYHVVMQIHGDTYTFLEILRRTWAKIGETDGSTSRFELARNTDATGTYCTHEWTRLGSKTFCEKLSHTAPITGISKGTNIRKVRRLLKAL